MKSAVFSTGVLCKNKSIIRISSPFINFFDFPGPKNNSFKSYPFAYSMSRTERTSFNLNFSNFSTGDVNKLLRTSNQDFLIQGLSQKNTSRKIFTLFSLSRLRSFAYIFIQRAVNIFLGGSRKISQSMLKFGVVMTAVLSKNRSHISFVSLACIFFSFP